MLGLKLMYGRGPLEATHRIPFVIIPLLVNRGQTQSVLCCRQQLPKEGQAHNYTKLGLILPWRVSRGDGDLLPTRIYHSNRDLVMVFHAVWKASLQWRHNGRDGVSNHQRLDLLAFVRGIHRWPVNSPHKESVTRKMFPFDDVIMAT